MIFVLPIDFSIKLCYNREYSQKETKGLYFMKRVVFLAAAAATLVQFTKYDLTALQTLGCEIHMVCNMQEGNISQAALQEYNQMFPSCTGMTCPF